MSHEILHRLECEDRDHEESGQLARLIEIAAGLPVPPHAEEHFPEFCRLQQRLRQSISGGSGDELEETFLELYAHLHMHEAPYTSSERRRMDETGGYWCHAGGLSPILKAAPHISEETVSADLGAGNGLQGLMLQLLYPHARTIQLELSSQMVEIGRSLQKWLGIDEKRVQWVVGDVMEFSPRGIDFLYLYRPVKPLGPGHRFYTRLAAELDEAGQPVVIFSIADCLRTYLSDRFKVFYSDGQLTCFRHRPS